MSIDYCKILSKLRRLNCGYRQSLKAHNSAIFDEYNKNELHVRITLLVAEKKNNLNQWFRCGRTCTSDAERSEHHRGRYTRNNYSFDQAKIESGRDSGSNYYISTTCGCCPTSIFKTVEKNRCRTRPRWFTFKMKEKSMVNLFDRFNNDFKKNQPHLVKKKLLFHQNNTNSSAIISGFCLQRLFLVSKLEKIIQQKEIWFDAYFRDLDKPLTTDVTFCNTILLTYV